jgi:phosphoribosylanthranilate isomerase
MMTADSDQLLKEFLEITYQLNQFHIFPYLMGSLAVELVSVISTEPDDIDIQLRQVDFDDSERISEVMENLGYVLIDLHEHKFEKENIHVGFASVESLKSYAGLDYWELQRYKNSEQLFFLPNIEQNIKIYEAATKDGWRNGKEKDLFILKNLKEIKEK